MKRFAIAVMVSGLLILPLASAQHGKGVANGPAMSHKPINAHNSGSQMSKAPKLTPSEMLASKPKLSAKLQSLLPPETVMSDVCTGFRNLGQCVAAVHVSHNLGIPFTDLKTKVIGTPATDTTEAVPGMSLGKAIQALDPHADTQAEINKANQQAKADMRAKS